MHLINQTKTTKMITRQNHYVPKWYQKRFLSPRKSAFYYLNLTPPVINLPNGRKKTLNGVHWPFSATQCFCQRDLYTTQYYGFLNDEIERYLFGKIDDIGVKAVREIVSARNSKIKFLLSDHPITIYNPACPPDSNECSFPNEPRIEMKATQTIFPLDSNRCLIFTNLDYARNPDLPDPKAFRPNANPYRPTLARMDNTICKRELNENEVAKINLIIKLRAKQFLAAEKDR